MIRNMSSKSAEPAQGDPAAAKPPSKSKLVKQAHKSLVKALEAHMKIVTGGGISIKKAQRAGAKVAAAAAAYADAVQAKAGLENPFTPGNGMLDGATMDSLRAEQTKLKTATIPIVTTSAEPQSASGEAS